MSTQSPDPTRLREGSSHPAGAKQPHSPAPTGTSTPSTPSISSITHEWHVLIVALMLSDLLSVAVSGAVAGYVRPTAPYPPWGYSGVHDPWLLLALYAGLFWLVGWGTGIYTRGNLLGGPKEYELIFRTGVYWGVATEMSSFVFGLSHAPRAWWLAVLIGSVFVAWMARFGVRRVAYGLRRRGLFVTRVLIAGANDQGLDIARQLLWSRAYEVAGFVDDYAPVGTRLVMATPGDPGDPRKRWSTELEVRVLGCSAQLYDVAAEYEATEAIVIPEAVAWDGLQTIVAGHAGGSDGPKIHMSTGVYDLFTSSMTLTQRGMVPLLTLDTRRLTGLDALLKSAFDRVLGSMLLIVLAPAGLLLALTARLRGMRPALEWREVVAAGGAPLRMPLFRRTVTDRLLLRGIPTLLCVVTGQLSLVGPRPIAREQASKYGRWQPRLMTMLPGLTGYWRLLPDNATLDETAAWDLWYLRNYSVWTDLFLLFQSGTAILSGSRPRSRRAVRRWAEEARPEASQEGPVVESPRPAEAIKVLS